MLRKKYILILVLMFGCMKSFAQTKIIHQKLATDTVQGSSGPNKKKFGHLLLQGGLVIANDNSLKYFYSYELGLGVRRKLKLNNTFALGFDVLYLAHTSNMKDTSYYPLPSDSKLKAEKIIQRGLQLHPWLRVNMGKHANNLGAYIDLGAYGGWDFQVLHVYKFENTGANLAYGKTGKYTLHNLPFVNVLNYGATARIGYNKVNIYATYRLSNLFKSGTVYNEFPRLNLGLQIALY